MNLVGATIIVLMMLTLIGFPKEKNKQLTYCSYEYEHMAKVMYNLITIEEISISMEEAQMRLYQLTDDNVIKELNEENIEELTATIINNVIKDEIRDDTLKVIIDKYKEKI